LKKKIKKFSKSDYIAALEKIKNSPKDRIGLLGDLGVTSVGLVAGLAASGTIASTLGLTTIFGSSTLGGVLGGVFVASTPVGWIVGSAVAAGAAAYGLSRVIRSGERSDAEKFKNIADLESRVRDIELESSTHENDEEKFRYLIEALQVSVQNGFPQEKSNQLLERVVQGKLAPQFAFSFIQEYLNQSTDTIYINDK